MNNTNNDYYCYIHDEKIVPVHIDEDGTIELDEYAWIDGPNGFACPRDDCNTIIYKRDDY